MSDKITLYTSNFCSHAFAVERFLAQEEIEVDKINISEDLDAREQLIELNGGYASVPTLIFPDGEKLTEPSFAALRDKLGIESPGLVARLKRALADRDRS